MVTRIFALAALALAFSVLPRDGAAQSGDDLRGQFEAVIADLNDNSFKRFHDAIDQKALLNRIAGTRVIANEAKEAFAGNFRQSLESMFRSAFPRPRSEAEEGDIIGTVISFEDEGGQVRAIVRYQGKGFRFSYHSYELARGRGGRVQIVDWFDYYQGNWFSQEAGNALVRMLPGKGPVASVLEMPAPTEAQLFQVGELLKAVRDQNPARFYQIHDGLDETLRREPFIVRLNYGYSRFLGDPRRIEAAVSDLQAHLPGDARQSLSLTEFYIMRRLFAEAITEFERFQEALGMKDGASESMKATAAMALGDFERAQGFALAATAAEPGLELAWWTLLRTRTAAGDYTGAVEALTELEDRFGHLLIPQKLRRDRFLRILIDQPEYQDWRTARDAA